MQTLMKQMDRSIDKHIELLECFKVYFCCNWVGENGHFFPHRFSILVVVYVICLPQSTFLKIELK